MALFKPATLTKWGDSLGDSIVQAQRETSCDLNPCRQPPACVARCQFVYRSLALQIAHLRQAIVGREGGEVVYSPRPLCESPSATEAALNLITTCKQGKGDQFTIRARFCGMLSTTRMPMPACPSS